MTYLNYFKCVLLLEDKYMQENNTWECSNHLAMLCDRVYLQKFHVFLFSKSSSAVAYHIQFLCKLEIYFQLNLLYVMIQHLFDSHSLYFPNYFLHRLSWQKLT